MGIRTLFAAFAVLVSAFAMIAAPLQAQDGGSGLAPQPPKGQGKHCVAETDFMRRNHMTMLTHRRDETVHEGVRTGDTSLTNCISCHAVKDESGQFVKYSDPKHFCRTCHDYAAVSVDCFECHASRPEAKDSAANDKDKDIVTALSNYLREKEGQR
jgi:hypothetical protein